MKDLKDILVESILADDDELTSRNINPNLKIDIQQNSSISEQDIIKFGEYISKVINKANKDEIDIYNGFVWIWQIRKNYWECFILKDTVYNDEKNDRPERFYGIKFAFDGLDFDAKERQSSYYQLKLYYPLMKGLDILNKKSKNVKIVKKFQFGNGLI